MDGKLQSLSVYIIEDHDFQRLVAMQTINSIGVGRLGVASGGQDALEQLQANGPVDIIVCDLEMPGMDGIRFIRHVAEQKLAKSLIILSALDPNLIRTVEDMAQAQNLKVLGTLPKPVSRERIRELMELYFGDKPEQGKAIASADLQFDAKDLASAIENHEFTLFYQPKVLLNSGRLVSVEALARWQHPQQGLISPARFIPLMESTGLINKMTLSLVDDAIKQLQKWQQQGRALTIGLNLSPRMLLDTDLPDLLKDKISAHSVSTDLLNLEITESSLIENTARALETLARLKMMGFSLSIDDFGTGYSSMQQLNRVPFSELKIDRSFVHNACNDATQRAIIEANISLAHSLNMQTVAEGIETIEDWNLLKQLKCHIAQGYFVAKPMPADELEAWEKQWLVKQPIR